MNVHVLTILTSCLHSGHQAVTLWSLVLLRVANFRISKFKCLILDDFSMPAVVFVRGSNGMTFGDFSRLMLDRSFLIGSDVAIAMVFFGFGSIRSNLDLSGVTIQDPWAGDAPFFGELKLDWADLRLLETFIFFSWPQCVHRMYIEWFSWSVTYLTRSMPFKYKKKRKKIILSKRGMSHCARKSDWWGVTGTYIFSAICTPTRSLFQFLFRIFEYVSEWFIQNAMITDAPHFRGQLWVNLRETN